jgi:hypothetical protein
MITGRRKTGIVRGEGEYLWRTDCPKVLALSEELKPHLLNLGVFDVLIPLTSSESIEVQGNRLQQSSRIGL